MSFWIDKDYNHLSKEDVGNKYLLNIINYIANGKGRLSTLSENVIHDLYDEAIMRGLRPYATRSKCLNSYRGRMEEVYYKTEEELYQSIMHENFGDR